MDNIWYVYNMLINDINLYFLLRKYVNYCFTFWTMIYKYFLWFFNIRYYILKIELKWFFKEEWLLLDTYHKLDGLQHLPTRGNFIASTAQYWQFAIGEKKTKFLVALLRLGNAIIFFGFNWLSHSKRRQNAAYKGKKMICQISSEDATTKTLLSCTVLNPKSQKYWDCYWGRWHKLMADKQVQDAGAQLAWVLDDSVKKKHHHRFRWGKCALAVALCGAVSGAFTVIVIVCSSIVWSFPVLCGRSAVFSFLLLKTPGAIFWTNISRPHWRADARKAFLSHGGCQKWLLEVGFIPKGC